MAFIRWWGVYEGVHVCGMHGVDIWNGRKQARTPEDEIREERRERGGDGPKGETQNLIGSGKERKKGRKEGSKREKRTDEAK